MPRLETESAIPLFMRSKTTIQKLMYKIDILNVRLFIWSAVFLIIAFTASVHEFHTREHFSFDLPDNYCKLQLFPSGNETISTLLTAFPCFVPFCFFLCITVISNLGQ
jgi:hypothetical protein